MKTYLKLNFSSEGELPSRIIKKLENKGWKPIIGEKDFVMNWSIGETVGDEYIQKLDELHVIIKGTGVRYTLHSKE